MLRYLVLLVIPFLISSCACPKSYVVHAVGEKDKELSCKDIVMEINETEFHRRTADQNKLGTLETYFNPLCFPTVYFSANDALKAANARLEYLNQIYELQGCDRALRSRNPEITRPTTAPVAPTIQQSRPPTVHTAPTRQQPPVQALPRRYVAPTHTQQQPVQQPPRQYQPRAYPQPIQPQQRTPLAQPQTQQQPPQWQQQRRPQQPTPQPQYNYTPQPYRYPTK